MSLTYSEFQTLDYANMGLTFEEVLTALKMRERCKKLPPELLKRMPFASATTPPARDAATREFADAVTRRPGESEEQHKVRMADHAWRISPKIRAEFGNDRVRYDAYNEARIAGKVKIRGRAA